MRSIIMVYNTSVYIETDDSIAFNFIKYFLERNYLYQNKGFSGKNIEIKPFYIKMQDRPGYFLHINQFKHLISEMKRRGIKLPNLVKLDCRDYDVDVVDYEVRDNWKLRENQIPVYEFLIKNPEGSKLVPLATGSGKTFISLYSIAQLKKKLGIIILPTYIDKWVQDILNIHKANPKDIMVIQGYKEVKALIDLAKEDKVDAKYFIFSSRTYQDFITIFENSLEECLETYGEIPINIFPLLKIGVLLIDETHQHFHAIFKAIIQTNVKYLIGLSATLMSDNFLIRKMHKIVYPDNCVYSDPMIKRYTDVYAIAYSINEKSLKYIRTTNYGSNVYSHIAFEKSIIRNNYLLNKYVKIIETAIEDYYIAEYQDDDKLLIFVSTVDFATYLTEHLKMVYNNYVVNRYCEDDPYENLMQSDIIVSTVISAGTAVDIKNLRVVIQTIAISSSVANIQTLGRLRKLEDRDTKFCYLYCNNIAKHREYHLKRMDLFKNRVKNIILRNSRVGI